MSMTPRSGAKGIRGAMPLVILVVVAVAAGYFVAARSSATIRTGRADAAEGAISILTDDWTYGVPVGGVAWTDKTGSWHEDGRPDCLPPGAASQIRFASVETTIDGTTWRPVVWVDCRGAQ